MSSTTTELDREALVQSAKIAGISDVDDFYKKMSEAAESYEGMTDEEIFLSDYKEYDMSGTAVGIACINASNPEEVEGMKEKMLRKKCCSWWKKPLKCVECNTSLL